MKSFVCMTYYQLMHAVAMALDLEEKPNLYFSMSYLNLEDKVLDRVRETGVFNEVVAITRRGENRAFLIELRKTEGASEEEIEEIGDSLFEKYLEPHYAELFKDADTEDEIFVYNDFPWHYYYISRHFKKIVGVEDGYNSLRQQISIHRLSGDSELAIPFIRKGYYPENLYRFKNVQRIISSRDFDDIDDYYKSKLEIRDFKDIVAEHREAFRDAMMYIFDMEGFTIPDKSSLILGQPLDRAEYCTPIENYFLNRIYVRNELEHCKHVFIKPHPAERNDPRIYGGENVFVLDKAFPVELLNFQDGEFARVSTFSSSGASIVACTEGRQIYFEKTNTTREEVTEFIEDMVKGEELVIDIFLRLRDLDPEHYITVYSWIFRKPQIRTRLHILARSEEYEDMCRYYAPEAMEERIAEYKAQKKGTMDQELWFNELRRLPKWFSQYAPGVTFHEVSSLDDRTVYTEAISGNMDFDYMILLDPDKPAFKQTGRIYTDFASKLHSAILFSLETDGFADRGPSRRVTINHGFLDKVYGGRLSGRLFHRELVRGLRGDETMEIQLAEIINSYADTVKPEPSISLYLDPDTFPDALKGAEQFTEKSLRLQQLYKDDSEYLAGQMAHLFYDYYVWRRVSGVTNLKSPEMEEIEETVKDPKLLLQIYRILANGLLYKRALDDGSQFFQNAGFYRGLKADIDRAAEQGRFSRWKKEKKDGAASGKSDAQKPKKKKSILRRLFG